MSQDCKELASDAWAAPSWRQAAHEYHDARGERPIIVEIDPDQRKRLRDLLKDGTSFSQVYYKINNHRTDGAPKPTVEALMLSLRERGTAALEEPATKRRLSELSEQQIIEVGNRLQRLRPEIARPWSAAEVQVLFRARVGK